MNITDFVISDIIIIIMLLFYCYSIYVTENNLINLGVYAKYGAT